MENRLALELIARKPATGSPRDLKRDECLRIAIRTAFPLPKTGAFEDLLSALDDPPIEAPCPS